MFGALYNKNTFSSPLRIKTVNVCVVLSIIGYEGMFQASHPFPSCLTRTINILWA